MLSCRSNHILSIIFISIMKDILLIGLLATLFGCNGALDSDQNSRPNIIVILVDDLGKEWVSCYGAEDIKTPNIDALAKEGIRFTNVYAMPQCTPTRLTFLTGQYPYRHGWVNHWDVPRWGGGAHFDERVNPSVGIKMKEAGYVNCIAGKWQVDDFRVEPDALIKNGFDHYCMWTGGETGVTASHNRYQDPYIFTSEGSKTYPGQFGPDIFVDYIQSFIQEHKDRPFFVYYPMVLTHGPLVETPDERATSAMEKHKAMVRYTDKLTGSIVQTLEELKIRDNTLIIWTTDNGSGGNISGHRNGRLVKGGKASTSEPGICLPFIANWPGVIKEGRVSDALIDFTDFYPTLLDLAGKNPPKEISLNGKKEKIDGVSFKDVLLNKNGSSNRKWILSMGGGNNARLTNEGVENQYEFRDRVIRNKRYKLYINSSRQSEQFYDLSNDPWEENNIIDSINTPLRTENFEQLSSLIPTFPKQDSDPKYIPNPPQKWDVKVTAKSQEWKK